MCGSVLQLNISQGGLPKYAIDAGRITEAGLDGDRHAHPNIHGGPRQALLLITSEGLAELSALGIPIAPGMLGENITTQGLNRREWRAGQRWAIGAEVVIEFTKMRAPCATLNPVGRGIQAALFDVQVKAGDPASSRWGLSGFYAQVLTPGHVRAGDAIRPA